MRDDGEDWRPGGGIGTRWVRERAPRPGARLEVGHAPEGGFLLACDAPVIRLLLADDQALVRGALAALLDLEPDLEVVAEVGRGDQVVAAALRERADVVLMDVEMPGLDGIAATAAVRKAVPDLPRPGGDHLRPAGLPPPGGRGRGQRIRRQGHPARQLAEAVRRVHAGLRVLDPGLAEESLVSGASPLTARETEVLRAARDHGTVADVAAALHLSEGTVRNHLSAAIGKTGARNRTEAVRTAEQQGWLL